MRKAAGATLCFLTAAFATFCMSLTGFSRFFASNVSVPAMGLAARLSACAEFPITGPALAAVCMVFALLRRRAKAPFIALLITFTVIWLPCLAPQSAQPTEAPESCVRSLCAELVDELNASGRSVMPVSEMLDNARAAMNAPAAPKAARYPEFLRAIKAAGIYIPVTGEALVDITRPQASLPFTAAHELAHMLGTGDETEANLAAYEACVARGGAFAYSARLWALKYAMGRLDDGEWIYGALGGDIAADLRAIPYSGEGTDEYAALTDCLAGGS